MPSHLTKRMSWRRRWICWEHARQRTSSSFRSCWRSPRRVKASLASIHFRRHHKTSSSSTPTPMRTTASYPRVVHHVNRESSSSRFIWLCTQAKDMNECGRKHKCGQEATFPRNPQLPMGQKNRSKLWRLTNNKQKKSVKVSTQNKERCHRIRLSCARWTSLRFQQASARSSAWMKNWIKTFYKTAKISIWLKSRWLGSTNLTGRCRRSQSHWTLRRSRSCHNSRRVAMNTKTVGRLMTGKTAAMTLIMATSCVLLQWRLLQRKSQQTPLKCRRRWADGISWMWTIEKLWSPADVSAAKTRHSSSVTWTKSNRGMRAVGCWTGTLSYPMG